jgi:hypothetical protein
MCKLIEILSIFILRKLSLILLVSDIFFCSKLPFNVSDICDVSCEICVSSSNSPLKRSTILCAFDLRP